MIKTIICEGRSEYNYIQLLNRLFRQQHHPAQAFKPVDAGGGFYFQVKRKLKEVRAENRRGDYRIWVDKDLYARNERQSSTALHRGNLGELFLFSVMNFEDFLVMHCADETLNYWIERCAELRKGLGSDILSSKEYLPAFLKLFPKYQKGVIPIEINPESLELCFRRHSDPAVPLKNDFAGYLMSLLELGELVYK